MFATPAPRLTIFGVAISFMVLEYWLSRLAHHESETHDLGESATTLAMAVGQHILRPLEAALVALPFAIAYDHRLFDFDLASSADPRKWALSLCEPGASFRVTEAFPFFRVSVFSVLEPSTKITLPVADAGVTAIVTVTALAPFDTLRPVDVFVLPFAVEVEVDWVVVAVSLLPAFLRRPQVPARPAR